MSFQRKLTHNFPYKLINTQHGKEKDSLCINHFHPFFHKPRERTSAFTSKGSITLEAAVVVPIFFFAILCLVYLFEMMAIQTSIRNALYSAGREVAQEAYVLPVFSSDEVEKHIVSAIGTERLERSMIVGGASGIDCGKSSSGFGTGQYELSAAYDLEIPLLMFRIPIISCEETLRVKGWNGYVTGIDFPETDNMVYITDYGLVYHEDKACTYLEMSIRGVKAEEISELRNQSGGKYYACSYCKYISASNDILYVTDYGTRYHNSLECSRIKRNVYTVPLDEVFGLGGCSKCVK